ncbi:permease prefix domain 1-containing protein [Plantactinospora sp. GCM10030261]|uniref:permease prefix domain 1-containing protein n=1 Tax=Plantactinospora sp. GCM10030261 TaxID=3273420 RepID=UPI00360C671A
MTTLTERYLAATLRAVPAGRRTEIADELRASIEDMISDRTAAGADRTAAERDVLTELGDPDQLAARYAGRQLYLIGPTYYLVWWRLLRLLLSFIPALVGVVVAVVEATDGDAPAGAVGAGVVVAFQVAVQISFWVTLVFAIFEWTNATVDLPRWTVDRLPDTPVDRDISLVDTAASIAMILLFAAWFPWQHYQSFVDGGSGTDIPILDPDLWTFWLPVVLAVLLVSAAFEIVKYRVGRWTWPLVAANVAVQLAFAVPVVWLLLSERLLNPALIDRFAWLREGGTELVTNLTLVGIAIVLVWSIIDTIVKARRHAR